MLLAATAQGVGSCWIAGDKKEYAQEVLQVFSVPVGYKLVSIISLGYPHAVIDTKQRKPLKQLLHLEEF